jgi:hypothetical protein
LIGSFCGCGGGVGERVRLRWQWCGSSGVTWAAFAPGVSSTVADLQVSCRASVPEAAYFSVCSLSGVFEGGGAGVSEDATKGVCLAPGVPTVGEARALLYAYDINESVPA